MSDNISSFSDYVTTTSSKRTQFLAGGQTQAEQTQASWRPDDGTLEAGLSYFLAVL